MATVLVGTTITHAAAEVTDSGPILAAPAAEDKPGDSATDPAEDPDKKSPVDEDEAADEEEPKSYPVGPSESGPIELPDPLVIDSRADFALAVLEAGDWPVTGNNICAIIGWAVAEGGHYVRGSTTFNPLNTSWSAPGSTVFNSHGVKNYPDWPTGVEATVKTIRMGFYYWIRQAMYRGNDAAGVLNAVAASPWGTKSENPVGWMPGGCLSWASSFDAASGPIEDDIAAAEQAIEKSEIRKRAAEESQQRLNRRHAKLAPQVEQAQRTLGTFVRNLYIAGVDPQFVGTVEAMLAEDPLAYAAAERVLARSADSDARAVSEALGFLADLQDQQQEAQEKIVTINAEIADHEETLAGANERWRALLDPVRHY